VAGVGFTAVLMAGSLLFWMRGNGGSVAGSAVDGYQVPLRPGRPELAVPRQLPRAVTGFAGRSGELSALTALLQGSPDAARAVVISAVDGSAGIGKTSLAIAWAHRWRTAFRTGSCS